VVVAASLRRGLHSAHRPSSSKTRVIALDFRCTSLGQIVHSRWRSSGGKPRGQVVTKQGADSWAVPPSWLEVTVAPNLAPLTHATYEIHVKNYIEPDIGALRLDRLRVADVQAWLNRLTA
jgi:hypothetical protein